MPYISVLGIYVETRFLERTNSYINHYTGYEIKKIFSDVGPILEFDFNVGSTVAYIKYESMQKCVEAISKMHGITYRGEKLDVRLTE